MYKSFQSMQELFAYIREDKDRKDQEAAMRNRYPVRFVLFENFADFYEFISKRPQNIFNFPIVDLIDAEHPDIFPTCTELGQAIDKNVSNPPANDYVVFPFSEMCRFYEQNEFSALVKTIKGLEPPEDAQLYQMRVYIPIVGMQGKMTKFMSDARAFVWEYKSTEQKGIYRLILTNGSTYGVSGLEEYYTVVRNLQQWLELWKKGKNVRKDIICTSQSIYLNAQNAQLDNAFCYVVCDNAYEFLTRGLSLDFGNVTAKEEEMPMWEKLSALIGIENFDLQNFVNELFDTAGIHNSADFIKNWIDSESDFDRWLLAMYFRKIFDGQGYICEVLNRCNTLSTTELFSVIAAETFDILSTDQYIFSRREALILAAKHGIKITTMAEQKVYETLSIMLSGSEEGKHKAIQLMTDFTDSDKRLAIEAYGKGCITLRQIEKIYPDLYHYLGAIRVQLPTNNSWIFDYFDSYRKAKITGDIHSVQTPLHELNISQSVFYTWYDDFKTVKTCLHQRSDIEVFYWIDGLGIDWLPFIAHIIQKHRKDGIFLNEIFVARAALPTTTSMNKPLLESLLPEGGKLEKSGDLDSFAHQCKNGYPQYLIDEMHIVESAITNVLHGYNGKKIAFVSDHGMTYTAQYGKGLSIAGIESDHDGRVAHKTTGTAVSDGKYVILEDGKTLCALTEDSLTSKTPNGHGAHGGATPEEVLVPIIIVSNQENPSKYSAELQTKELSATNPILRLRIKGLTSIDMPQIEYNNASYYVKNKSNDIFVSEKLNLVDTATKVTLRIGGYTKDFTIKISTGAQEDDLFGDL